MLQPANKTFNSKQKPRGASRLLSVLSLIVVVGIGVGLVTNGTRLMDWYRLRGYTPDASVVRLANDTTMNSYARHLFYLNKPGLATSVPTFRQDCPENEDTIVLGCYHPVEQGIFVYNVPDPMLAGVQQVTAAHETLHAIYSRLSSSQRATVDAELNDFYEHKLTNPRVKAEIAIYKKTEPNDVTNEMHSIFGTEVAELTPALETYYKQYFTDRAKIISYSLNYEAQFMQRQTAITNDDQQLSQIKQQIDSQQAELSKQLAQINTDRSQINSYAAANDTARYNAAVPGFNAEIDNYNTAIAHLQNSIANYNQLVASRNQIAAQLTTLNKALDTRSMQQVSH